MAAGTGMDTLKCWEARACNSLAENIATLIQLGSKSKKGIVDDGIVRYCL